MYCSNCGKELEEDVKFCSECSHKLIKNKEASSNKLSGGKLFGLIIFIVCVISGIFSEDTTTPRSPDKLECVEHKGLCIATTDVKYDYTTVKTKTYSYPGLGKEWNNGWASAQKACEAWGGRLPYMEEFSIIVDAFNNHKIDLKDYGHYLSNTQINTYRIWAYSHDSRYIKEYNNKSIYDAAISIAKSGDHHITGQYDTSTAYTWSARCVKD